MIYVELRDRLDAGFALEQRLCASHLELHTRWDALRARYEGLETTHSGHSWLRPAHLVSGSQFLQTGDQITDNASHPCASAHHDVTQCVLELPCQVACFGHAEQPNFSDRPSAFQPAWPVTRTGRSTQSAKRHAVVSISSGDLQKIVGLPARLHRHIGINIVTARGWTEINFDTLTWVM